VSNSKNILVIGGGISGLACAWRLRQQGWPVQLIEGGPHFGGVIDTIEKDGFRFDIGPQSFLATEPLMALIEELGIGGELLRAEPRAPRYILLRGRLVQAPMGPGALLRTPLIGRRTKLRLLTEPFGRTHPPEGDESIAAFVRRKFGEDLLVNLAGPFVAGIYAGDPEKLSLASTFPMVRRLEESFGSVIRGAIGLRRRGGARPALCNFRKGMLTLVNAMSGQLGDCAKSGARAVKIGWRASGGPIEFDVTYSRAGSVQSISASAIVVATPTSQAGPLLAGVEPRFAELLAQVEYASVAQVAAGYRLAQIARFRAEPARGFGFLVPRSEGLRLLGTVWGSFLFAERAPEAPEKMASFTSFVGGATDPEICRQGEDEIARIAHGELAGVLGISGPPVVRHVALWEHALPQYNLGHARVVAALGDLCAGTPGIFLAGNYLSGPSVGASIECAYRTADAVAGFLGAQA
jgi:oxygen-dependent protoporphyrinogen oxidase